MAGLDSPYRLASAPAGTPYIADFDNDRGSCRYAAAGAPCPPRACAPRPVRPYRRRGATPAQRGY
ncbi:hypothetical protein ABMX48_15220 [Streptomyces cavourensis]